ncbi:UNVERIFIED_CONTAM: hypothetical protein HHA_315495 [Hammondia hammondi]|eukprot:XP_008883401.1 hypothetical protein HHA_315495 [Hammondia hammondi]
MQTRFSPRSVKRTATGGVRYELKRDYSQKQHAYRWNISPTPSNRVETRAAVPRRPRQDTRMRNLRRYQFPVSWLFQSEVVKVGTSRKRQAKRNSQRQPLYGLAMHKRRPDSSCVHLFLFTWCNPTLHHSPATITDRLSEFLSGRVPDTTWSKSAKTSTFRTKHT